MLAAINWGFTNRGIKLLIDDENYEYRLNKKNKGKIFYLCRKYDQLKCKAMFSINDENATAGDLIGKHNHGSDIGQKIAKDILKQ